MELALRKTKAGTEPAATGCVPSLRIGDVSVVPPVAEHINEQRRAFEDADGVTDVQKRMSGTKVGGGYPPGRAPV